MNKRFMLFVCALLCLSSCKTFDEVDRGMPQQVRLYRSPGYVPLGNNDEDGFSPSEFNCSGGDRLRGWC